jgi:hypothetical protein
MWHLKLSLCLTARHKRVRVRHLALCAYAMTAEGKVVTLIFRFRYLGWTGSGNSKLILFYIYALEDEEIMLLRIGNK